MPFSGKATYSGGVSLPEIAEDVSDIVGLISPWETPLLDHLGDPRSEALSTRHEWMEDSLLPNADAINQTTFTPSPTLATAITVDNADRFQVGDQVRPEGSTEVMLVTAVAGAVITVVRGYGSTTKATLADNMVLTILGNAALEGDTRPAVRFTNRSRKNNFTQIFTATVDVSGSQLAATKLGVADEFDYQKQERLRELLRDLENCVVNGVAPASNAQGDAATRRTLQGIIPGILSNRFSPGVNGFPAGGGAGAKDLTETVLNTAMRLVWDKSNGPVDTILVGGLQKRRINSFISGSRGYEARDTRVLDKVSVYESDFGVCRVVLSRFVPPDSLVLCSSQRLAVMPLAGRAFHFKKLASTGDSEVGQVIGEYTLEMKNEGAHALISGLSTT
jgi:hypothetical protein